MILGQTVKVKITEAIEVKGRGIPEVWAYGKLLETSGIVGEPGSVRYKIGYGERSSYREDEFPASSVVKHTPLSEEAHEANVARDLPVGVELANDLLSKFMPTQVVVLDGETIVGFGGGITINPVCHDVKTIGGLVEKTGWELIGWTYHPATRWEPEDRVDSSLGIYPTINKAVEMMVKAMFSMELDGYLQARAEAKFIEDAFLEDF